MCWGTSWEFIDDVITTWFRRDMCEDGFFWKDGECMEVFSSCKAILEADSSAQSGLYVIDNDGTISPEEHYCLMVFNPNSLNNRSHFSQFLYLYFSLG